MEPISVFPRLAKVEFGPHVGVVLRVSIGADIQYLVGYWNAGAWSETWLDESQVQLAAETRQIIGFRAAQLNGETATVSTARLNGMILQPQNEHDADMDLRAAAAKAAK